MEEQIHLFDTTLRDGKQSPGASMTFEEKLVLAKLGVNTIEAEFAAFSQGDFDSVQEISHTLKGPRIVSLCRAQDKNVDRGCKALNDLHLKHKLKIDRATAIGKTVRAGAVILNVPDTVGYTTPRGIADPVIFSAHCHNDLGLAVANSLSAVQARARQVRTNIRTENIFQSSRLLTQLTGMILLSLLLKPLSVP